jgi:hypothetical protein
VEYRRIQNDVYAGGWLRADIPAGASITAYAGTVERVSGNTKGFWLQGPDTGDFTATLIVPVTVDVSGYDTKFSWCAYASDCPPQALPTTSGYTLRGEPPFIIQTASNPASTVTHNTATYADCIYSISDKTGAPGDPPPPVPSLSDFTASAASICAGQSVTLTATATNAQRYSFDNGVTWQTAHTKTVSPTVTTTYALKASRTAGGCTVTHPVPQTVTVYPTPDVAFDSNTPAALCTNATATLSVTDLNSVAGSYCFTYECNECERNPYLTGNNEAAAVGCSWFSECIYGTANTYTVSMYDAGTMTVWAKAITEHGCVDSVSRVFAATGASPPVLTHLSGSTDQTVDVNTAIADIKYTTANASGATVTGLPAGVSGAWAANTYTVSGTPSTTGTFNYTVTTTNSYGCANVNATGKIVVNSSLPPPNSGSTWACGSQVWSGMLRNPAGCSGVSTLSTDNPPSQAQYKDRGTAYGYYYNWTCVSTYAAALCPSPWRVPDQSDFTALIDCTGGTSSATLATSWQPLPGYCGGSANWGVGAYAPFWSATPTTETDTYVLQFGPGGSGITSYGKSYGLSVRCVK